MNPATLRSARVVHANENIADLLPAARFGVPVCPHAGEVGLCERVQHFWFFDRTPHGAGTGGEMHQSSLESWALPVVRNGTRSATARP